jgi:hypothetical protein
MKRQAEDPFEQDGELLALPWRINHPERRLL